MNLAYLCGADTTPLRWHQWCRAVERLLKMPLKGDFLDYAYEAYRDGTSVLDYVHIVNEIERILQEG